jgi:hypothetical protein
MPVIIIIMKVQHLAGEIRNEQQLVPGIAEVDTSFYKCEK